MSYQTTEHNRLRSAARTAAQKRRTKDSTVYASLYAAPAGIPALGYSKNSKTVTVNGEAIPVSYLDGDRAVVKQSDLDSAYQKVLSQNGIKTEEQLRKNWEEEYGTRLNAEWEQLRKRGNWSYQPEQDPVYRAYRDLYEREGKRAYQNALAEMAAKNRGNVTAAAVTAANQQLGQYLEKLSDRIPQLAEDSYQRYRGDYERDSDRYSQLSDLANAEWKRMREQNEQAKTDYRSWNEAEAERSRQRREEESFYEELSDARRERTQAQTDAAWQNAERRGYFTEEEIRLLQIPKKADGTYPTPEEITNGRSRRYYEEVEMPRLDYESRLKRMQEAASLARKAEYDAAAKGLKFNYDKALAAYKASLK